MKRAELLIQEQLFCGSVAHLDSFTPASVLTGTQLIQST
jgi:hypothetical protein